MARILAAVAVAALFATLVKAEEYGRYSPQEPYTLGVQPQKYVAKCEHSEVPDTQLFSMDYAWTVSGLNNTFKFHRDQKKWRVDLETEFNTTDFPAKQIRLKISSCNNTFDSKLSVAAFYETPETETLTMYKFNVAVNIGQQYLVIPEAFAADLPNQEFASLKALLYKEEIGDRMTQGQEDWFLQNNNGSSSNYDNNNVDKISIMNCEHGIDGNIISSYITSQSVEFSPIDAITFIFKFTAIKYSKAPTAAAVPMSTSQCGPADQMLTYDTLFGNGYGQVQY